MYFENRSEAGQALAKALSTYKDQPDTLILALPRGGVPVAYEVSRNLGLPLDVLLVRKLGVPGQEEFAMGAIAEGNIIYVNEEIVEQLKIPPAIIDNIINRETTELNRRRQLYRHDRPAPALENKTIILIDDGLATGATMHAAVNALRQINAKRLIVAVPVGAGSTCQKLAEEADDLICLHSPYPFNGVGQWYGDFSQTSDKEVEDLLMRAKSDNRQTLE